MKIVIQVDGPITTVQGFDKHGRLTRAMTIRPNNDIESSNYTIDAHESWAPNNSNFYSTDYYNRDSVVNKITKMFEETLAKMA